MLNETYSLKTLRVSCWTAYIIRFQFILQLQYELKSNYKDRVVKDELLPLVGSCEDGNEPTGFINYREFLDGISHQLLKKISDLWS